MNIRYKIDKETIMVTDETGVNRKIPKYDDIQKVLAVENEMEVIDGLIETSQSMIDANKNKKSYIVAGKWKYFLVIGCVMMLGTFISAHVVGLILTTLSSKIIAAVIICLGFITGFNLVGLSLKCLVLVNNYGYQNNQLSNKIDHLKKIREAKKHQLDLLKQRVNNDKQKEETFVPIRELTIQERLHEMATLMDYIDKSFAEKMPVSETDAILQEIEETTKQKVLNMR